MSSKDSYKRTKVLSIWAALATLTVASIALLVGVGSQTSQAQGECGGLRQQAELGTLSGDFTTGTAAFRTYVAVPDRTGPAQPDDHVDFCVTIPATGFYTVEGATFATSGSVDSFFVSFDQGPRALWDVALTTGWAVDPVSARNVADPVVWQLSEGQHLLRVAAREDGTRLDRIQVSAHPGPATDLGLLEPNCSLSQEAENGVLFGDMQVDGTLVGVPNGSGSTSVADRQGSRAEYCVRITEAGAYRVDAVVLAPNSLDDSFFVYLDGPGRPVDTPALWDLGPHSAVLKSATVRDRNGASPVLYDLDAGTYTFVIALREDGSMIDSFTFTLNSGDGPIVTPTTPAPVATNTPAPTATTTPVPSPTNTPTVPTATATPMSSGAVPTSTPQVPTSTPVPTVQTRAQWPMRTHSVPGKIEAEDYDRGGAELAYHDADPANLGGWIRANGEGEGVDLTEAEDPKGTMIAWIEEGEWTEYTFTLDAPMTVDLGARVASGDPAAGDLEVIIDGEYIGTIDVRDSGGWYNWETIFLRNLDLPAGEHTMRLTATDGGSFNLNWVRFDRPIDRTPFFDITVPGRIEAENFDIGGAGLTYADQDTRNYGVPYRWDAVDIYNGKDIDGSYYVGRANYGDWTEYTFDASTPSETYDLDLRVAPRSAGWGTLRVFIDDVLVDTMSVPPSTGGQQNWRTMSLDDVAIADGEHILRLAPHNVNINYVDVAAAGTTLPLQYKITDTEIYVDPVDNLGLMANRAQPGTTFILRPGVHLNDHVNPKNGQKFIGEDGAILDGGNQRYSAFDGGAANVEIRNLEIRRYAPNYFRGAISGRNNSNYGENGTGWIVADNEIHSNNAVGVNVGNDMWVLRNNIHNNTQIGISGLGRNSTRLTGLLIKDNEIHANSSPDPSFPYTIHEGGLKITFADDPRILTNHVHDNFGIGLYCDLHCDNPTFTGNVVTNNIGRRSGGGIFIEISTGGTIENNTISNPAAALNAERVFGVRIGESTDVTVRNNNVTMDGGAALEIRYWDSRPASSGVVFKGNKIIAADGRTEIRTWPNQASFVDNIYMTNAESSVRFHHDGVRTWDEWLALGHDNATSLVAG